MDDGEAYCWGNYVPDPLGDSDFCCLGDGSSSTQTSVPVRVDPSGASDFKQISVGQHTICAVRGADQVWCWGSNDYGGLGTGAATTEVATLPQLVTLVA